MMPASNNRQAGWLTRKDKGALVGISLLVVNQGPSAGENLTIILETKLEAGGGGRGDRRRWNKFLHENKTIQLCFLPNAGGLWKLGAGGGAVQGKGGPVSCGQRSQGARVLQFHGQNRLAMQVELWFSPQANLQNLKRGNLANASGTIFACRVKGKARGRKRLHTHPHTVLPAKDHSLSL